MAWQFALKNAELKEGQGVSVVVPGRKKPVALFRSGGAVFALVDECTHAYAALSESAVKDHVVTCPWHGARFDVRNGQGVGPLAYAPVKTFPVRIVGDDIQIDPAA